MELNEKGQKGEVGALTAVIPSGGIILWSGLVSNIPSGWYLCNGQNGTPDLRNTFVIGAHSDSGGSAKTTITGSSTQSGGSKDAILVSHTHNLQNHVHGVNLTTNNPGNHQHTYVDQYVVIDNGYRPWPASNNDCAARNVNTGSGGAHTHTVSGNTGTPSTNTTDTLGESATNKNLPPYYALCYIMKS